HTERHFQEGMNCVSCHSGIVHDEMKNKVLPSRDRCYTCHLDAMSSLVRRD
ncbi:MAG: cytochrome C, partial [Selenomonadaceae bacterium]|nr:cytochrome C [Selenomonadaceae bacterium]